MTAVLQRHPAATYFILTFAISWGGVLLAIGGAPISGTAPSGDPRFAYAVLAMIAGPSLAGILLTALVYGRKGLREYGQRLIRWRVDARWYAVALLSAPILWSATLLVLSQFSPTFLSGVLTTNDRAARVLVGLTVALAAGVFEELGWTGFAIPQLRRRYSVFATGFIVGALWGAWHLLTNVLWASGVTTGALPLHVFLPASVLSLLAGGLPAFRVLMVWVYDRTQSVLVAMLMHVSVTASVLILDPEQLTGEAMLTYAFGLAAAVWAAVAVVAVLDSRQGWQQPQWRRAA